MPKPSTNCILLHLLLLNLLLPKCYHTPPGQPSTQSGRGVESTITNEVSVALLRCRPDHLLFVGQICPETQCDELVAAFLVFWSTVLAFPLIAFPEVLVLQISL
jgi:hypothetical protein